MKTKEIEVWVPRMTLDSFARSEVFTSKTRDMVDDSWLKAKLIIELPEKKVTISESEFDRLIGLDKNVNTGWVKNKLFGDKHE